MLRMSKMYFLFLLLLLSPLSLNAQVKTDDLGIPAELSGWTGWVSAKHPEWSCAVTNKKYDCLWPGSIAYVVSDKGGKFTVKAQLLAENKLELPSLGNLKPANLEFKDQAGRIIYPPLETLENGLFATLPAGEFSISGEFFWDDIPSELPVPQSYGLFDLKFEGSKGSKLDFSRLENSIRFQDRELADKSSSVSLKVFRKFTDSSPLIIETLLRVQVSGGARSHQIGKFLPENSHLINVDSSLPYQISPDGSLSLQLLPGSYDLYFTSVIAQPVSAISLPTLNADIWPKEEVWSWNANTVFRSVEVSGALPVEASLTEIPDDWKASETYLVSNNAKITLNELRRGKEIKPYSKLYLNRSLWIDLDGKGYTVSDNFSGELQQINRLNAQKDTILGRATLNNNQQLITIDPEKNLAGVEIRDTNIMLNTVSRIAKTKTISAVGWDTDVDSLNINLNLPPSWMLFATLNTSSAQDSWFESWSLFEVFILILIAVASYKIFGLSLSVLITLAGILNYREFLAPNLLIIHIIVLEVCRRLVKNKESFFYKLFNGLLIGTFALWILASLTFTKLQFTQLLFPQLQSGTRYRTFLQEILLALENSLMAWPLLLLILAISAYGIHRFFAIHGFWKRLINLFAFAVVLFIMVPVFIGSVTFFGYSNRGRTDYAAARKAPASSYLNEFRQYEADEYPAVQSLAMDQGLSKEKNSRIFQSGPATPNWKWRSHAISVNGPVGSNHNITLFLLSPKVTRMLSAARSLIALLLILYLFKALSFRLKFNQVNPVMAAAFLSLLLLRPGALYAETPSDEILKELENRMSQKICNTESCGLIRQMNIELASDSLSMFLDVSSDGQSSVSIPGPISSFQVKRVLLNGKEAIALKNSDDNYLQVKTVDGNNRIVVQGSLPDDTSFALEFADYPLHVKINAPGWYVEGLSESGEVTRGLHFTKEESNGDKKAKLPEVKRSFNSWVIAKRSFHIGESVYITTNLERLGDISSVLRIELPLLENEFVTNKDAAKEGNKLIVFIPAGEKNYLINSSLNLLPEVTISAKETNLISEEWNVSCEGFVSCAYEGLKPTSTNNNSKQEYQWHPFPGEEVKVKVKTLALAPGEYLTVDKVFHTINWGSNRRAANLQISLRATKQLSFEVKLNDKDKIENVLVDNVPGTSKVTDSSASVLLSPGTHEINISYAKEWQANHIENAPVFTANVDLHNINVTVNPSNERWVVWTGGGHWGPSVVFWAKIIVLIFLIHMLVKIELLDLSFISTILLGLGLSTLPVIWVCIPLFWLVALKYVPLYHDKYLKNWRITKAVCFWILSLISLVIFYNLVRSGLVLEPPMLIVGNNSNSYSLRWFFDHAGKDSPSPWVISFPMWYWRAIALVWSGWFVFMLFEWLKRMVDAGRGIVAEN